MKVIKIVFFSFLFLCLSVTQGLAIAPSSGTPYNASAIIQINLKSYPRTEVVRVQGSIDGKNNSIGDLDGDGKPDIETEIVGMNMIGVNSTLGEISLKNNLQDKKNRRVGELRSRGINSPNLLLRLPADSFFDIFIELRRATEVLVSCEQVHLSGISRSLTDLSGVYSQRISGKISLCNLSGEPVGTINFLAVNLNSSKSN